MHSTSLVRGSTVSSLPRLVRVWYKIPMAFIGQHSQLIAHTLVFLGRYPITVYHTLRVRWEERLLDWDRAALDFDRAFVVSSIKTCDVELDWQKELGDGEKCQIRKGR